MIIIKSSKKNSVFSIENCPDNIKENWLKVGIGKNLFGLFWLTETQLGYTLELLINTGLPVKHLHEI